MAKKTEFPSEGKVEVVMKKIITYEEYQKMILSAHKKGWRIQAYEVGFYNDSLKQKIK